MSLISRRSMLALGAAALVAQERRKLKVVVTGGHPGDPEYGCGGTAARYAERGDDVVLLYLNRGDTSCGATNPRVDEANRACKLLQARPVFAGQCDGHAVVDEAHSREFSKLVDAEQPDVVFAQWPVDAHADHRAIASLAYQAWLGSGRRYGFYYYEVSDGEDTSLFAPTDWVDVSGVEAKKRAACYAHASQSPDKYYAMQSAVMRFRGVESGHAVAEAFIRHPRSPNGLLP